MGIEPRSGTISTTPFCSGEINDWVDLFQGPFQLNALF